MYKGVLTPLFLFMLVCMFGTAITELYTNQWTGVLFKTVTNNSILILTFVASVQVLGRAFAAPIVHRLAPQGVLLASAILSALGVYLLINLQGDAVFLAAVVFGLGVAFFWPCMIGFVAENIPKSGALGINLMGGGGMLAVSFYTIVMGHVLDDHAAKYTASGVAPDQAKTQAGFDVLHITQIIPIILIIAFIGLVVYMRSGGKKAAVSH